MTNQELRVFRQTIGGNIRRQRLIKGWTPEECARRIGIRPALMHRLEHGSKDISLTLAAQVAAAIELPIAELFKE